jgi:thiol-disulfide isomerase/thioredoxin
MIRHSLSSLACMLLLAAGINAADVLKAGDTAPPFAVNKFVKGEPVKQLQLGQIYVIEFWATWCGPCIANIPKITAMQEKHGKKVVFIGVSVWERDQSKVVPFVTKQGSKMNYRVAMDKVGPNQQANQGHMATQWLKAAGKNGIPCAFIVNKEGKIAWIGHPAQMEPVLDRIVAGMSVR